MEAVHLNNSKVSDYQKDHIIKIRDADELVLKINRILECNRSFCGSRLFRVPFQIQQLKFRDVGGKSYLVRQIFYRYKR